MAQAALCDEPPVQRKINYTTEALNDKPVSLIFDDTDAPKSARKSELIGKIFSHLVHKSILGYKCLTLLLSDGLSQLFLEFSLHETWQEGTVERTAYHRPLIQIASFKLTMMQYNILCTVKRYETIRALFRETTGNTLELSAADRIWELILDNILEIAEMISADACELLSAVVDENSKFHKLYQMYKLVA